jgi:predicted phosphodiesterase
MIKSYKNRYGTPIIRKCGNCDHFRPIENSSDSGYCKMQQLYFAFTHEKSVYSIVKDFYLCEEHKFNNEDTLKAESEECELTPYLLDRLAKKKL